MTAEKTQYQPMRKRLLWNIELETSNKFSKQRAPPTGCRSRYVTSRNALQIPTNNQIALQFNHNEKKANTSFVKVCMKMASSRLFLKVYGITMWSRQVDRGSSNIFQCTVIYICMSSEVFSLCGKIILIKLFLACVCLLFC